MIPLTLTELAEATGLAAPDGADAVTVTAVEFDSRKVRPGTLFVALRGEHVDGHDFAEAARASGAVAVLGTRPAGGLPLLRCPDTPGDTAVLDALAAIAHRSVTALADPARGADALTVVGLTGSSGKTSTKDLVAAVLSTAGETVAPPESFNNELGHPYTVLRAGPDTRYLVLELSARGRGHIAALTRVAPLRIGAVLNVGSAHLGEFGSVEAIAEAKGELVEALPPATDGGVAVLNVDDRRVAAMAARTAARVVTVGTGPDADVRAVEVTTDELTRAAFTVVTATGSAPVRLQVVGEHQVSNALSAAAIGLAAGLDLPTVAAALSAAAAASRWRMQLTDLPDGITVINDAYNANPDSMRAALRALATIGRGRTGARTWAVLGPMAELGPATTAAHDDIGRLVVRLGIDHLVAVAGAGPELSDAARLLHLGAHLEGSWGGESVLVPDVDAALAQLRAGLRPGDVVLVKASRAAGLERVALALIDERSAR
jgi:UDP-N-acetylmuramoyl-tripeptide--D-alanyl-D-alanine ligase